VPDSFSARPTIGGNMNKPKVNRYATDPVYREKQKARSKVRQERPEIREQKNAKARQLRREQSLEEKLKRREYIRDRQYNNTEEDRRLILSKQGGLCPVCNKALSYEEAVVDHNHGCCPETNRSCGKCVRGMLHTVCNSMILSVVENKAVEIENARNYLKLRTQGDSECQLKLLLKVK